MRVTWDLPRPILEENAGWALFLSTPRGRNALFKLYQVAQEDASWHCQRLTIHDTGASPASILEEERRSRMEPGPIKSEHLVDFAAATVGSVHGDLLGELQARGGITEFDSPKDNVFTSWDLRIRDRSAIWFWRLEKERVDLIDHHENRGKVLAHHLEVSKARGYSCEAHLLPHDAGSRTWQTGASTVELAREALGPSVSALPILPASQGIEALRWLLQRDVRIHSEKCAEGLAALRDYSYRFDEDTRTCSRRPSHGWPSHGSDAARYLATVVRPMLRRMKIETRLTGIVTLLAGLLGALVGMPLALRFDRRR